MNITYFVHDLSDAAVARRVVLFQWGGATPRILGFHRQAEAPETVGGVKPLGLGQTFDAKLGRRALAVFKTCFRLRTLQMAVSQSDIVVCRNLEMLILGVVALAFAGRHKTGGLVYECLDIHRKMLGSGLVSRSLRSLERILLRKCQYVIVSSPAFASEYFKKIQHCRTPILLIENKTQSEFLPEAEAVTPPVAPPWTIGWFGNLRCQKSLIVLSSVVEACPNVRVHIAGKPALTEFEDFEGTIERSNGRIIFSGAYKPEDLPALYARCHFTWAIDYFEEGQNSSWLLPNRLYEGGRWGAVPIALRAVETGRWLQNRDCGILLTDPSAELYSTLSTMTSERYHGLLKRAHSLPLEDLVLTKTDGIELVTLLASRTN